MPPQAKADPISESYGWKKYNEIAASYGVFNKIKVAEGGVDSVVLKQDKNDPLLYTSALNSENCSGTLKVKISNQSASVGNLAVDGKCDALKSVNNTEIRLSNSDQAIESISDEAKKIKTSYLDDVCKDETDNNMSNCQNLAEEKVVKTEESCREKFNYLNHVTKGNAYLDCLAKEYGVDRPAEEAATDKPEDKNQQEQKCNLYANVGWIVCQFSSLMAGIADQMLNFLKPFMQIEPLKQEVNTDQSDSQSSTYQAWSIFNNIAIVLIIFISVYALISSMIGSNPQLSLIKMVPRIAVVSVLMVLSFFISAIAVDISNITGSSINWLLNSQTIASSTEKARGCDNFSQISDEILSAKINNGPFKGCLNQTPDSKNEAKDKEKNKDQAEQKPANNQDQAGDKAKEDEPISLKINNQFVVGASVIPVLMLAFFSPFLILSIFSMLTVILILLFRQAAVILLTIISPLAFLMLTLPGTKRWFSKWSESFISLLAMYPVLVLIFAGSKLASDVIGSVAVNNQEALLSIFALGIQVIPLFIAPLVIKVGGKAINKFNEATSSFQNPIRGWASNRAKQNQTSVRQRAGISIMQSDNKLARGASKVLVAKDTVKIGLGERQKRYRQEENRAKISVAERITSGIEDPTLKNYAQNKLYDEAIDMHVRNIDYQKTLLRNEGVSLAQLQQMSLTGQDENGNQLAPERRQAAIRLALESGADGSFLDALNAASPGMTTGERSSVVAGAKAGGQFKKNPAYGAGYQNAITDQGSSNPPKPILQQMADTIESGKISPTSMANMDAHAISQMHDAYSQALISRNASQRLRKDIETLTRNQSLRGSMNQRAFTEIRKLADHIDMDNQASQPGQKNSNSTGSNNSGQNGANSTQTNNQNNASQNSSNPGNGANSATSGANSARNRPNPTVQPNRINLGNNGSDPENTRQNNGGGSQNNGGGNP